MNQEICELNGYRYYLGPEAPNVMNWDEAKKWCEDQGFELPSREVLLQCYCKLKDKFNINGWYWSSDEFGATYAWVQSFSYCAQDFSGKGLNYIVRAVRKEMIYR